MRRILLGHDATAKPVFLEPDDFKTHTHVVGPSGSGKSKFLESLMREHLRNGQGFALLDPHGTLCDAVRDFATRRGLDRGIISLNPSKHSLFTGHSVDLREIMDQGKILLVNLAACHNLSPENARVFGSKLVNEFFENALRREHDKSRRLPQPYSLFLDEFASFVSVDIANMLAPVRKFGLFLTLAHQSLGQLNEEIVDSVLANCRIKIVFGGLPTESARLMAQELFVADMDRKYYPQRTSRPVHMRSTGSGNQSSEAYGESDTDIPICVPVPFEKLSSVQYHSEQEQLTEMTAALLHKIPGQCLIKIHGQKAQFLRVLLVHPDTTQ